ncbi:MULTISPECIES: hypothetical protein [unclassified Burkholderia]|uniref:hypothetical protein n=1 Tax=unclassified Burkholderia TaxID=2613784 RepID=UPI0013776F38|nr:MULTISPECIES: hypothetical protein [unclassified Burkholderia]
MLHCIRLPMRVTPDIRGIATNTQYAKILRFSNSASTFRMPSFEPVSRQLRQPGAVPAITDQRGGRRGVVTVPSCRPHCAAGSMKVTQPGGQPIHEPRPSMTSDREPHVVDAAASSGRAFCSGRSEAAIPACRAHLAHLSPVFFPRITPRSPDRVLAVGSRAARAAGRDAARSGVARCSRGGARRTAGRPFIPTWLGASPPVPDGAGSAHE